MWAPELSYLQRADEVKDPDAAIDRGEAFAKQVKAVAASEAFYDVGEKDINIWESFLVKREPLANLRSFGKESELVYFPG